MFGCRWAWELSLFMAGLLCSSSSSDDIQSDIYNQTIVYMNMTSNNTSVSDDDYEGECLEVEVYSIVSNTMVLVYFLSAGFSWGASTQVDFLTY